MAKFLVTARHGRVFKTVSPGTRVLVAIPGQEISVELAEECGLIEKPAPPPEPEPETKTKKKSPVRRDSGEQPPSFKTYPTRVHKAN